jgi:hypothetical protein
LATFITDISSGWPQVILAMASAAAGLVDIRKRVLEASSDEDEDF